MRSFILRHHEIRQGAERRAKNAEEGTTKAQGERDEARQEVSRLRKELAKSREDLAKEKERSISRLKEKDNALQREVERVSTLNTSLSEAEARRREAEKQRLTFEERVSAAIKETEAERGKATEAEGRKAAVEEELAAVKVKTAGAEERAASAEGRAAAAEERATVAERQAKAAEAQGARAVEEYKLSSDFRNDAADLGANAYSYGFQDCRELVRETFPDLDLRRIVMEGEEEGETNGAGEAVVEEGEGGQVETQGAPMPDCELGPEVPRIVEAALTVVLPATEVHPAAGADGSEAAEVPLPSAGPVDVPDSISSRKAPVDL